MTTHIDQDIEKEVWKEVKKESRESNKIFYLGTFPNLVDLVINEDNELEYLVFDPGTKKTFTTKLITIEGKNYQPPLLRLLPHNFLFPRKEKVLHYIYERAHSKIVKSDIVNTNKDNNDSVCSKATGDDGDDMTIDKNMKMCITEFDIDLYNEIILYYKERAELPEEELYDLITVWAFHTYAMERADFSPIIYFLGLPEKGKSRMLKSMTWIARRGLRKISLTDAQILRDCTDLDATIALDMMSLWTKVEKAGSEDVFLNRPERGVDVSRVNRPEKGAFADTDYYTVFGATIFATNENIHEILDTRAIPIIMVNATKDFNLAVKPTDALPIKEKLTAWRACTMGDTWENAPRIARSRLGDITQPLYQIILNVNPERAESFRAIIQKIENRRLIEKVDSTSGQIIMALLSCKEMVEKGCIKGQIIANKYNEGNTNTKYNMQSRTILNRLRAMGLETQTMHGGYMGIVWNEVRIEALRQEFNIEHIVTIPKSSPTSQSSPTSLTERELYYAEQADKEI